MGISPTVPMSEQAQAKPVEVIFTGVPKIRVGGIVTSSSDVFREAEQVWTAFIYGNKIDRVK